MEKENTTKTAGEAKEGCGCGDIPAQEEKGKTFMDCCSSMCKPEDMSKMWKDCCNSNAIPEVMKEKMKGFFQGKSQKA
ncbi:MAG: hypothetical protein ABSF74_02825 [Dehalococcoidia bacterium]|jgi:uncharacterized Fe-S center protein